MNDRLTVYVTANELEGALARADDVAARYFGDRSYLLDGTSAESTVAGYFKVMAVYVGDPDGDDDPTPPPKCPATESVTGAFCRLPKCHLGPHLSRSGRLF